MTRNNEFIDIFYIHKLMINPINTINITKHKLKTKINNNQNITKNTMKSTIKGTHNGINNKKRQ
jgi:hypothetical protein